MSRCAGRAKAKLPHTKSQKMCATALLVLCALCAVHAQSGIDAERAEIERANRAEAERRRVEPIELVRRPPAVVTETFRKPDDARSPENIELALEWPGECPADRRRTPPSPAQIKGKAKKHEEKQKQKQKAKQKQKLKKQKQKQKN